MKVIVTTLALLLTAACVVGTVRAPKLTWAEAYGECWRRLEATSEAAKHRAMGDECYGDVICRSNWSEQWAQRCADRLSGEGNL